MTASKPYPKKRRPIVGHTTRMPKTRHAYCGTCGKLILAGDVVIFHSAPTKFRSAYYRCRECPAEGARIVPAA